MIARLNRYSFLLSAAAAMAGAWAISARIGGLSAPLTVAGVGLAFAFVQRRLRGGPSSLESWQQFLSASAHGVPALLFIYSDT